MALEETTGAEGVETENTGAEPNAAGQEQQQVEAAAGTDGEGGEQQAPSLEDIASRMGWVPKDKFKGDEAKWRPAEDFILAGRDIQDRTARELREVRETLDTIKRTNASIMEQRLAEQREELQSKFEAAVAKGDPEEASKIRDDIGAIDKQRETLTVTRTAPAPETDDWVKKNAWYDPRSETYDPVAAERAIAICNQYAKANLSAAEQLKRTEAVIRREFPHLFPADDKAPAQVIGQTTRNTAAPAKKSGTYADMPKEAKAQADDLVDRGLIKDKEQYARNYFAQVAKGQ